MMIDYSYHFFLSPLSFLFYYHIPKHVDLEDLGLKMQELSVDSSIKVIDIGK